MGTFGTGTFENDAAMDFVGDLASKLRDLVDTNLSQFTDAHFPLVVPVIACLHAIAAIAPCTLCDLTPAKVAKWRDSYLQWVDGVLAADYSPADVAAVRSNAEDEFDRLATVAATS